MRSNSMDSAARAGTAVALERLHARETTRMAAGQRTRGRRLRGFAGVQQRGAVIMGVNQYTSRHVFEPLADGGRIELQRSVDDSAGRGAGLRARAHAG